MTFLDFLNVNITLSELTRNQERLYINISLKNEFVTFGGFPSARLPVVGDSHMNAIW